MSATEIVGLVIFAVCILWVGRNAYKSEVAAAKHERELKDWRAEKERRAEVDRNAKLHEALHLAEWRRARGIK
jgi:hypothetical protein